VKFGKLFVMVVVVYTNWNFLLNELFDIHEELVFFGGAI
jgi:uncharacterized membrane protein